MQIENRSRTLEHQLSESFGNVRLSDESFKTQVLIPLRPVGTDHWHLFSNRPNLASAPDASTSYVCDDRALKHVLSANMRDLISFRALSLSGPHRQKYRYTGAAMSVFNDAGLLALGFAQSKSMGLGWQTGPESLLLVSVGSGIRPEEFKAKSFFPMAESMNELVGNLSSAADLNKLIIKGLSRQIVPSEGRGSLESIAQLIRTDIDVCSYYRLDTHLQPELHATLNAKKQRNAFLKSLRGPKRSQHGLSLVADVGRTSGFNSLTRFPVPEAFNPY